MKENIEKTYAMNSRLTRLVQTIAMSHSLAGDERSAV